MITQIQLGNIFTQNDKTILSGSASGLDIESLVNGLVEARRQPAVILETSIETNNTVSTQLTEMRSLLDRFRDAANFLRNPPGVRNEADNVFEFRSASVSSNTAISGSAYLDVTAEPGANATQYDISIQQLATRNVHTTNTINVADLDTAVVGTSGSEPIQAGTLALGASGFGVELEDGDSLNQVVAKINAASDQSGVEAIAIKVTDGEYRLSLRTVDTGTAENYTLVATPPPPAPEPAVVASAVFRLDAQDVDGDGNGTNNPTADTNFTTPGDGTGGTGITTVGDTPLLDVDGSTIGEATFNFAGVNGAYAPTNSADINLSTTPEKGFALSFKTGSDLSGTQVIYEQGGAGRSFNVFTAPDAGNGNQPTLYAVAHNVIEWAGGSQYAVLNLGVVSADTDYNVVLDFDASVSPNTHDPANTFTGYVNGAQVDQVSGVRQQFPHGGAIAIGGAQGDVGLNNTTFSGNGLYFEGQVNEVILFNQSLSSAEATELSTYFQEKHVQEPIGVADPVFANIGFAIIEEAQDAILDFDGTEVIRGSNNIDDIVEGVTFNINQATPPGTELTVDIEEDLEIARQGILNFVDAYNQFRLFASAQTETGNNGEPVDGAVLASDPVLTLTTTRINSQIAFIVDGITDGDPNRLADIGITFSDFPGDADNPFTRNILVIDEDVLDNALAADFDAVRKVFEFDSTSDDPDLQIFQRTNALGVSSFSLDVDQTNGVYQASYTDDDGNPVVVNLDGEILSSGNGVVLTGRDGTVLEGLSLIYGSNDDATMNVRLSQGIGDRVFNTLETLLDEDTGTVTVELRALVDDNDRIEEQIARIDEQLESYRDQLLAQFSSLEAAITSANTLLQTLDAQAQARQS